MLSAVLLRKSAKVDRDLRARFGMALSMSASHTLQNQLAALVCFGIALGDRDPPG